MIYILYEYDVYYASTLRTLTLVFLDVFLVLLMQVSVLASRLCLCSSMSAPLGLPRVCSVVMKLASVPCRSASRSARSWTGSATRTHSLSGNRRTEQHDISEDDLDVDEVESKLEALVK